MADLNIEDGGCTISVGGSGTSYSITVNRDGTATYKRGETSGTATLESAEMETFTIERDRLWECGTTYDFAPAQHSIPYWGWRIAIRVGDETRHFEGDAYDDWAPRSPADTLVFWMRDFIDTQ